MTTAAPANPASQTPPGSVPPAPNGSPSTGGESFKWLGKFKDDSALLKSTAELLKANGTEIDPDKIVGPEGLCPTIEGCARIYSALESARGHAAATKAKGEGQQPPAPDPAKPTQTTPAGSDPLSELFEAPKPADEDDFDAISIRAKVDAEAAAQAWVKDGKLSDADYAKYAAVGITRGLVNQHFKMTTELARAQIQTREQTATASKQQAAQIAGGETELENLMAWARSGGITPDRLATHKAMVQADPRTLPEIVRLIKAEYAGATNKGSAPAIAGGTAPSGANTGGFTDPAEFRKACTQAANLRAQGRADPALEARIAATPRSVQT